MGVFLGIASVAWIALFAFMLTLMSWVPSSSGPGRSDMLSAAGISLAVSLVFSLAVTGVLAVAGAPL